MSQTYSPPQIDMRKQNVVLTFSLAALFALFMAITSVLNLLDSNRNITFAIVSVLFFSVLAFFYFNRIRYFSLALMFCFMFSLILGIPAVYLIFTTMDANFQLFLLSVIWVNLFLFSCCPLFEVRATTWRNEYQLSQIFYLVFLLVAVCQFYKIFVYASFLISSGLGHLAIYTEGDELHASVPFIIRSISGFSNVLGLAVFLFPSSKKVKFIGLLMIASDLVIGVRNKFFFSLMALFILVAIQNRQRGYQLFKRMTGIVPVIAVFVLLSVVSYVREGFTIDFTSYLLIVLDSLSSTVFGIKDVLQMSSGPEVLAGVDPALVFRQFFDLIGIGSGDATVAQAYTHVALSGASEGIALSSSILLESMIVSTVLFPLVLFGYCILFIVVIDKLLQTRNPILNLCGIAMLPFLFYTTRAEMVQPFVSLFKALPVILISYLFFVRPQQSDEKNLD